MWISNQQLHFTEYIEDNRAGDRVTLPEISNIYNVSIKSDKDLTLKLDTQPFE